MGNQAPFHFPRFVVSNLIGSRHLDLTHNLRDIKRKVVTDRRQQALNVICIICELVNMFFCLFPLLGRDVRGKTLKHIVCPKRS